MGTRDYTAGVLEELGYGFGAQDIITVPSPAAGQNASLVVSRAGAYRPLAVVCHFVADANAANRWVELDYVTDAGRVWCRNGGAPIFTASTTLDFCWHVGQGMSDFASSGSDLTPVVYPLAPILIPQGHSLQITVGNKQATDALTGIVMVVEEIVEGPRGYPIGRVRG